MRSLYNEHLDLGHLVVEVGNLCSGSPCAASLAMAPHIWAWNSLAKEAFLPRAKRVAWPWSAQPSKARGDVHDSPPRTLVTASSGTLCDWSVMATPHRHGSKVCHKVLRVSFYCLRPHHSLPTPHRTVWAVCKQQQYLTNASEIPSDDSMPTNRFLWLVRALNFLNLRVMYFSLLYIHEKEQDPEEWISLLIPLYIKQWF